MYCWKTFLLFKTDKTTSHSKSGKVARSKIIRILQTVIGTIHRLLRFASYILGDLKSNEDPVKSTLKGFVKYRVYLTVAFPVFFFNFKFSKTSITFNTFCIL